MPGLEIIAPLPDSPNFDEAIHCGLPVGSQGNYDRQVADGLGVIDTSLTTIDNLLSTDRMQQRIDLARSAHSGQLGRDLQEQQRRIATARRAKAAGICGLFSDL